jgi:hypothetical protein
VAPATVRPGSSTAASGRALAATGGDPRLIALAGLTLLLAGLGLRLRTLDEIF